MLPFVLRITTREELSSKIDRDEDEFLGHLCLLNADQWQESCVHHQLVFNAAGVSGARSENVHPRASLAAWRLLNNKKGKLYSLFSHGSE